MNKKNENSGEPTYADLLNIEMGRIENFEPILKEEYHCDVIPEDKLTIEIQENDRLFLEITGLNASYSVSLSRDQVSKLKDDLSKYLYLTE